MKLVYQCMVISLNFYTTSNHLHPLQVENFDSISRLVVDEDDYGEFRLQRVDKDTMTYTFENVYNYSFQKHKSYQYLLSIYLGQTISGYLSMFNY